VIVYTVNLEGYYGRMNLQDINVVICWKLWRLTTFLDPLWSLGTSARTSMRIQVQKWMLFLLLCDHFHSAEGGTKGFLIHRPQGASLLL
jgi:hypothetical protein